MARISLLTATILPAALLSLGNGCTPPAHSRKDEPAVAPVTTPTVDDARAFMDATEADLRQLWSHRERSGFVQLTYITHDTETLSAQAEEEVMKYVGQKVREARRFQKLKLPDDLARKFLLLGMSETLPAPQDAAARGELARIATDMQAAYGKGKYCTSQLPRYKGKCVTLDEMEHIMGQSRDEAELRDLWLGWRTVSPPMRAPYARYVELANQGAKEIGYADLGELWRSGYDMSASDFAADIERLWSEVAPLYQAMHCHVRRKLREHYGDKLVPATGPIPAHLLGNMWAQEWGNIYPLVAPNGGGGAQQSGTAPFDLTASLKRHKVTPVQMVKYGEGFFTSLGLMNLPDTFWTRSMFVRPRDRDVMCHASAWDITSQGDVRLKMCIEIDADNFRTVHHELGHDYYYLSYRDLPPLFQQGAHDGFHEAIGDTMALSITPEYLVKLGLLDKAPPRSDQDDIAQLLKRALDAVAFLPFGKLIDQWRWEVFAGKIKPADYNAAWWALRTRYQGVAPPVPRSEADFDPGAKYHVPANVPYTRYFLARILQYQLHRALCQAAGHTGPLHTCSIYGNTAAGDKLKALLSMGASKPWPDALEKVAGTRRMDGGALLDYYRPLLDWLNEQNRGQQCGW